jgi:hypothetical protein
MTVGHSTHCGDHLGMIASQAAGFMAYASAYQIAIYPRQSPIKHFTANSNLFTEKFRSLAGLRFFFL